MEIEQKSSNLLAVFFDLDNTLIATRKADVLACKKLTEILWKTHGVPFATATAICNNFLRAFRECPENPRMDLDTWRLLLWTDALGEQFNKLTDKIYEEWIRLRYNYLSITPEIKVLLENLHKNYFLGLITNGPSSAQWEKVERLQLKSFFDIVLVSGDLPWEKPHFRIFHEACDYLGIEPHQCIMVGDKLETDVLGGINAQLGGTVWIPLTGQVMKDNDPTPDYVLKCVTELPTLLPQVDKDNFKDKINFKFNKVSLCDVDDCSSNSSDGS